MHDMCWDLFTSNTIHNYNNYWMAMTVHFMFFLQDLLQYYGRKGERSIEESARLVGLKLPQEPSDE